MIKLVEIKKLISKEEKSNIANSILRQLPEWFGIEEAILEYVQGVKETDVYVCYISEKTVGLISVKANNEFTHEIFLMSIIKGFQNRGIGKKLLKVVQDSLKDSKVKFLMVKTLGESHPDKYNKNTREFYHKAGFYPLEENFDIWGRQTPCLLMVKNI